MMYVEALDQCIDDGIEAARQSYIKPRDKLKLEGSIQGFEDCRTKTPVQLLTLLTEAGEKVVEVHREGGEQYWFWRCRQLEIEWVCNVMSHIQVANGGEAFAIMTARGGIKAADIIGVREAG